MTVLESLKSSVVILVERSKNITFFEVQHIKPNVLVKYKAILIELKPYGDLILKDSKI